MSPKPDSNRRHFAYKAIALARLSYQGIGHDARRGLGLAGVQLNALCLFQRGRYRLIMASNHSRPTGLAECTVMIAGQYARLSHNHRTIGLVVSSPPRSWSRLICVTTPEPTRCSMSIASALLRHHTHVWSGGFRRSSTHSFINDQLSKRSAAAHTVPRCCPAWIRTRNLPVQSRSQLPVVLQGKSVFGPPTCCPTRTRT